MRVVFLDIGRKLPVADLGSQGDLGDTSQATQFHVGFVGVQGSIGLIGVVDQHECPMGEGVRKKD